jgi:hypothetical protein
MWSENEKPRAVPVREMRAGLDVHVELRLSDTHEGIPAYKGGGGGGGGGGGKNK